MNFLLLISCLLCSLFVVNTTRQKNEPHMTPVILVPGDGGNQIYAKYKEDGLICPVRKTWFLIWVSLEFLNPVLEFCMSKYFKLNYNATTRKTENQPFIQTKIKGWGDTNTIDYLDSTHYSFLAYYGPLISALVKKGYTPGLNIRGAPFDFRKAPNENVDFVPMLKALVEDTYTRNNATRVMLVAHSMGNLYTLYFLRAMNSTWKKKFVRGFVATSAPIGGAVKSVRAATAGDRLSGVLLSGPIRDVLRSMPSTTFLFPSPAFWKADEVIARRPGRNYTVANFKQLFEDMPFPNGWEMYKDTSKLVDPLWIPDVDDLYCAHGTKMNTPAMLDWRFEFEFPNYQPSVKFGDGDGTVNLRSLNGCERWHLKEHLSYPGAEHVQTLSDSRYIADIIRILSKPDNTKL